MKVTSQSSPNIAADSMTGSIVGMSAKGMDMANYFLRDKIYSDKILACVREYICNGEDEHKKHGVTQALFIDLSIDPADNKWYWTVRDFAKGLDDHGIRNVFGMYFESTKSGDNNSIGGFGIGSKAGMSYSDSFYITSFNNGVKSSYICTLGAGNSGVPVGQIFDLSTEPTTESGLEIKIEVSPNEVHSFHATTVKFVGLFDPDSKIEFTSQYSNSGFTKSDPYTPITPVKILKLPEGCRLSMYDKTPPGYYGGGGGSVWIRMGGVVYASHYFNCIRGVRALGTFVLDVPIGKLSIPISRESIESTPANDKVYLELEKVMAGVLDIDRTNLKLPTFADVLDECNNYYNAKISGEWFEYSGNTAFPDTYTFLRYIERTHWTKIPRGTTKKHIIYLMPDIKNTSNWKERLSIFLKTYPTYGGHFYMTNNSQLAQFVKGTDSLDVSDIDFVDVKSLKLPTLPKTSGPQTQYLVYINGYREGSFTAEEMEKHVVTKTGTSVDFTTNWWESVTSVAALNRRTITTSDIGGIYHKYYVANSKKFVEALHTMGWLSPGSQEYTDTVIRINKLEEERQRHLNAEPTLRNRYFDTDFHPNIIKAVAKDEAKLERLSKIRKEILAEDSTRARILKKLVGLPSYDDHRRITRQDLRKILTLK